MNVTFFKTPNGEEFAFMSRAEYESLKDSADHARIIAGYRAGEIPGLSEAETMALVEAPSPLTFWRKRAGLSQADLATAAGISQGYLSDIENGRRDGTVAQWVKIARALSLPLEALIDGD